MRSLRLLLISALACSLTRSARAECWTHNAAEGQGFATPEAACSAAVQLAYNHPDSHIEDTATAGTWGCYEVDEDGDHNYLTLVTEKEPEPYCTAPICGPYSHIPDMPSQGVPGAVFTSTQRATIKNVNIASHRDRLVSDIYDATTYSTLNKMLQLWLGTTEKCNPLLTSPLQVGQPCYGEVHHIIPAHDSYGCPCGTNSNRNAMVISKRMNGSAGFGNRSPLPDFLAYVNQRMCTN